MAASSPTDSETRRGGPATSSPLRPIGLSDASSVLTSTTEASKTKTEAKADAKSVKKSQKSLTKITRKHPEFELSYDMMLGIRHAVSVIEQSVSRNLVSQSSGGHSNGSVKQHQHRKHGRRRKGHSQRKIHRTPLPNETQGTSKSTLDPITKTSSRSEIDLSDECLHDSPKRAKNRKFGGDGKRPSNSSSDSEDESELSSSMFEESKSGHYSGDDSSRDSSNDDLDGETTAEDVELEREFSKCNKFSFPSQGSGTTPGHCMRDFQFKDYSPNIFAQLREWFGINTSDYLITLCGDFNFLEFLSNSKSGQFFFFSHNKQFLIKTLTHSEVQFLRVKFLPYYFKYVSRQPYTLLTKFFGLHRVTIQGENHIYIVIMSSVFYTDKTIHEQYDLKGSTKGRKATAKEKKDGAIWKDLDFVELKKTIKIGSEKARLFKDQLRRDTEFLRKLNIMDYSLLVGIHYRDRDAPRRISVEEMKSDMIESDHYSKHHSERKMQSPSDPIASSTAVISSAKGTPLSGKSTELSVLDSAKNSAGGGGTFTFSDTEIERQKTGDLIKVKNPKSFRRATPKEFGINLPDITTPDERHTLKVRKVNSVKKRREQRKYVSKRGDFPATDLASLADAAPFSSVSLGSDKPSELGVISDMQLLRATTLSAVEEGAEICSPADSLDPEMRPPLQHRPTPLVIDGDAEDDEEEAMEEGDEEGEEEKDEGDVPEVLNDEVITRLETLIGDGSDSLVSPTGVALDTVAEDHESEVASYELSHVDLSNPFTSEHGGMCVVDDTTGERGNEIFFVGIIDVLQKYNRRKKLETFFVSLKHDVKTISALPPEGYSKRFVKFLEKRVE